MDTQVGSPQLCHSLGLSRVPPVNLPTPAQAPGNGISVAEASQSGGFTLLPANHSRLFGADLSGYTVSEYIFQSLSFLHCRNGLAEILTEFLLKNPEESFTSKSFFFFFPTMKMYYL